MRFAALVPVQPHACGWKLPVLDACATGSLPAQVIEEWHSVLEGGSILNDLALEGQPASRTPVQPEQLQHPFWDTTSSTSLLYGRRS